MLRQEQTRLLIDTMGQNLYEFTPALTNFVANSGIETGQVTAYCRHSSASLTIQENADPDVQRDLVEWFRRQVRENEPWYRHVIEGPDDMPAHIKSALTDVSITIPVMDGLPALGTWQGIYLFEHRRAPHQRQIILHMIGA